jgi:Tol biopolymer transport system component
MGVAGRLAVLACVGAAMLPGAASAAPAGSTLLVSRPDGLGAVPPALDNHSGLATFVDRMVSSDGRYVLFWSDADGLAPALNPFVENLFVRDTQTNTTTLVSRSDGFDGAASEFTVHNPQVAVATIGGQPHVLVVFDTVSQNMVDHATGAVPPDLHAHVYLRDVTAGTTTLLSRADGATGALMINGGSDPSIGVGTSGPVVAFHGTDGVFLRRVDANDTELISCKNNNCAAGVEGSGDEPAVIVVPAASGTSMCQSPTHAECALVAYRTGDTTITNEPAPAHDQIVVASSEPGKTTQVHLISRVNASGVALGNGDSLLPSWSGDGKAVAFVSDAGNLVTSPAPPAGVDEAYVRFPDTNSTIMVSRAADAAALRVVSVSLGGNAGALRAAFQTNSANLGFPANHAFLRDVAAGTTTAVDRAAGSGGALGDRGIEDVPMLSADGSAAIFVSRATNLGDGGGTRYSRVHVRRLSSPGEELDVVSIPSGTGLLPYEMDSSALRLGATSTDGRFVVFTSASPALGGPAGTNQVFVRDLALGRTTLASRADGADGAPSATAASAPTISADGRRVAFSSATALAPDAPTGVGQVYVRDIVDGTTTLVSRANGATGTPATVAAGAPVISADGRRVAFVTQSALDPAGAGGVQHVYLRDLAAQTTTLVDRDDGAAGPAGAASGFEPSVNADGSRVAWVTSSPLAGSPNDTRLRVFLRDLGAGTTTLVSRAEGAAGAPASFDSRTPQLDAAGDTVVFTSAATNLTSETFSNSQAFVRDITGGHTELVSRLPDQSLPGSVQFASIDGSGTRVAFQAFTSFGSRFVSVVFVRDLPSQTTEVGSRADGATGATGDGDSVSMSMAPSGDCVAFTSASTNLGDGFASADYPAVHLRVLRGECAKPPPVPDTGGGSSPPPPDTAPAGPSVLTKLSVKPKRFRTKGPKKGATIRFTLSAASRVTLRFFRLRTGHRKGKRCLVKVRRGKRCTIAKRVGLQHVAGKQGANRRRFAGKLGGNALPRGRYRLTATPAKGKPKRTTFTVLKPRR